MQKKVNLWIISCLIMAALMSGCSRERVQNLNNRNASQSEPAASQSSGALPTLSPQNSTSTTAVEAAPKPATAAPTAVEAQPTVPAQPTAGSSPSTSDTLADDLEKSLSNLETQLKSTDLLDDVQ